MERSLSALLPVCDAQFTLCATVLDLLDVVPDLTDRFEIVIVDDGSTDATIEVADDLAAGYPQVKALRHATRQGRLAAICTGLANSQGEIVFVQVPGCTVPCDEMRRLWERIGEHEIVLGRVPRLARPRRDAHSVVDFESQGGFYMLHRRAVEPVRPHLAHQQDLRNFLTANHLQWQEVEVRDRALQPVRRQSRGGRAAQPVRRPNYLDRIRQFALGE